jgi:undecaprenyl-diphosphatase
MIQLQYIMMAFVQAATEFLPVSSSGHLLFLKGLFQISDIPIFFDIIVHAGSLTAILVFYRKQILTTFHQGWLEVHESRKEKRYLKFLIYIAISTIITFSFYLLFNRFIETYYQTPALLSITYLITTMLLMSTFFMKKKEVRHICDKNILLPFIAGLFQGIAIFPGISRSGATIAPLILMRVNREEAAFYSFFLAVPAILGALVYKSCSPNSMLFINNNLGSVIVSFLVSSIFSYIFLWLLNWILKRKQFWIFSIYTLSLAIAAFILFR